MRLRSMLGLVFCGAALVAAPSGQGLAIRHTPAIGSQRPVPIGPAAPMRGRRSDLADRIVLLTFAGDAGDYIHGGLASSYLFQGAEAQVTQ